MKDEILNPHPFSRSVRRDFEENTRCYFGGGGGSRKPPAPSMPAYTPPAPPPMPAPPPPPPPPPPAPTFDTTDSVNDAGTAEREDAARRKGIRKTVMAGETGGYKNPVTGVSLLG